MSTPFVVFMCFLGVILVGGFIFWYLHGMPRLLPHRQKYPVTAEMASRIALEYINSLGREYLGWAVTSCRPFAHDDGQGFDVIVQWEDWEVYLVKISPYGQVMAQMDMKKKPSNARRRLG